MRNDLTQLQHSWLEHLQSLERSGSTLKTYAERHGLDHPRLYRFKRILSDKGMRDGPRGLDREVDLLIGVF